MLELLDGLEQIRFAYRDASTTTELELYLRQWTQRQYSDFGFGYLAFHGDPGLIYVGRRKYTLQDLGTALEGRCEGRVLYFGSCATLDVDREVAEDLRRRTKARAVCGYTEDVPMIEGCAFELNLISSVTWYARIDAAFKYLTRNHGGACDTLGLRATWGTGSLW